MTDHSRDTEPSLQFSIRTMLIATAILAAALSLLKWAGLPTFALALIVSVWCVDLVLIAIVILLDRAWFRWRSRRAAQRRKPSRDQ